MTKEEEIKSVVGWSKKNLIPKEVSVVVCGKAQSVCPYPLCLKENSYCPHGKVDTLEKMITGM